MSGDRFLVPRRFAGTPWELSAYPDAESLIPDFYQPFTPFLKAVGYGLFALTDDHPDEFQEVDAGDILEVIDVAKYPTGAGTERFHGQHYRDAFVALERLFNVALPMITKRVRREGRKFVQEKRLDRVRLLDGFSPVYRDPKTGNDIRLEEDLRYAPYRVDISGRHSAEEPTPARSRRRGRKQQENDQPVWAMVKCDQSDTWLRDASGLPILRTPDRYRFRWGREVVADLMQTSEGRGWLAMNRAIFRVLRNLRHANNGRGSPMAARLFELIVSDIMGKGPTRQRLEKSAKLIFAVLGCPDPGSRRKGQLHKQDGRWARNVQTVAEAVKLLKAEGVLLKESDEEPYSDPNPERRKAPYYRWIRAREWTFSTAIDLVDEREACSAAVSSQPAPAVVMSESLLPPVNLFGETRVSSPKGSDIRGAREAAGLTLRQFAARFGSVSHNQWGKIEREEHSARTGLPVLVPEGIRRQVADFVAEHLGCRAAAASEPSDCNQVCHANGPHASR